MDYTEIKNKQKKKSLTKSEKKVFIQQGEKKIKESGKKLDRFTELNKNTNHINYKIFHLFRDPFVYVNAYTKISKNKGALTEGCQDENIVVNFGLEQAKRIAKKIIQGNYNFSPVKRTWVPKPGRKTKRPVDVPTQSDRIVQEVVRGILEAVYEPVFKEWGEKTNNLSNNYGFRPKHSTWSALEKLQKYSQRCNIVIEGDIISAYNNVDHDRLLGILRKRIKDKKFLKLIKNMLKSGVIDGGSINIV